jgi:hypothetical protein
MEGKHVKCVSCEKVFQVQAEESFIPVASPVPVVNKVVPRQPQAAPVESFKLQLSPENTGKVLLISLFVVLGLIWIITAVAFDDPNKYNVKPPSQVNTAAPVESPKPPINSVLKASFRLTGAYKESGEVEVDVRVKNISKAVFDGKFAIVSLDADGTIMSQDTLTAHNMKPGETQQSTEWFKMSSSRPAIKIGWTIYDLIEL